MAPISDQGLTALIWTFVSVDIVLTAGRYAIRIRNTGGLHWDDAFHGFALASLIAFTATLQHYLWVLNAVKDAAAGTRPLPPTSVIVTYTKVEFAVSIVFLVCINFVKLAFLMLYWTLFSISKRFRVYWWVVMAFTLASFSAEMIAMAWNCGHVSWLFDPKLCLSYYAVHVSEVFVTWWCPLIVVSDVLIIILPLGMLHTLNMSLRAKSSLAIIFSLAVIDIVFDILRTLNTVNGGAVAQSVTWDVLEPAIAVLISCMPPYRGTLSNWLNALSSSYRRLRYSGTVDDRRGDELRTYTRFDGTPSTTALKSSGGRSNAAPKSVRPAGSREPIRATRDSVQDLVEEISMV